MPTPMLSKQWPRFILPIIRKEWEQRMAVTPAPAMQFFSIQGSTQPVEYSQGVGSFGLVPEYDSATPESNGANIQYDSFSPLYETTFTHKEYAKGVAIERKLWDDERSGQIKRKAQNLGFSFGTTRAVHAASVFNNAFSTNYLGGDAKPLISTTHPYNANDATAWSNKGTAALSYGAVIQAIIAGNDMKDDRGNPLPVMYDALYVPTALQATAYEITKALAKPGTADNDANFLSSKGLSVVVDPYLTDTNNWFLMDTTLAKMHLIWFNRVLPEIALDPTSDFNLVAKYRGYMRYSFGWDDAHFIFGSEVA